MAFFWFLSCRLLMTPPIYLVTPCGESDPQVENHCHKAFGLTELSACILHSWERIIIRKPLPLDPLHQVMYPALKTNQSEGAKNKDVDYIFIYIDLCTCRDPGSSMLFCHYTVLKKLTAVF